jgi:hypothetical protein
MKGRVMIHYSCDRCKRILDPEEDLRYVVKIEVHAAMEPLEPDEDEEDRDYLMEIQDILERAEDGEDLDISEDIYQKRRFDLCSECYRKYIKNPVGREASSKLGFSQN